MNRKVSSFIFLAIIILFSFPWVMISCAGQPLTSVTGFQAIRGSYPDLSSLIAEYGTQVPKAQPNIWLVLAFITAIVGIIVGLLKGDKVIEKALIVISSLETSFLIIFPIQIMSIIRKYNLPSNESNTGFGNMIQFTGNMIQVSFRPAYYLALILSILSIILNAYALNSYGSEPTKAYNPTLPKINISGATDYVFCPNCGAKNIKGNKFCSNCGAKLP